MDFTYEQENRSNHLETYEWERIWIEHADKQVRRLFYIGDSISCNIRQLVTAKAGGELYVDGIGTSKAVDNPFFKDLTRIVALQQGKREAVLFNNGLHGWHLEDETEYARFYEDYVVFLKKEFADAPLFIVLTTFVSNEERCKRVQVRNRVACEIAAKYDLPVIDLYTPSAEIAHLLRDGVHFQAEGNDVLAEYLLKEIRKDLGE